MIQASRDLSPTPSQWAILAVLRFFLSATVVFGHFSLFIRLDPTGIIGDGYLNPGSAVYGFFIVSGFSIASSIDRETTGFYKRRFERIWPLYLSAIAFGLVVAALLVPNGYTWPRGDGVPAPSALSIIASVLMLQMVISNPIAIVGPIWSLSSEWWHYMIAPWLKRLPNSVLTLFIGISFLAFVLMLPPGKIMGYLQHGGVMLTSSWLWVTGFLYYRLRGTAKGFVLLALPSVLALTLGRFTGAPLFISIFVIVLSSEFHVPKQYLRACNFLGDYSYALYLFHIPAMIAALALGARYSITALISAFAVSLAAIYGVDYPSRKLFRYRRARSSAMMPRENA